MDTREQSLKLLGESVEYKELYVKVPFVYENNNDELDDAYEDNESGIYSNRGPIPNMWAKSYRLEGITLKNELEITFNLLADINPTDSELQIAINRIFDNLNDSMKYDTVERIDNIIER